MRSLCLLLFLALFATATAQDYRWQQRVEYKMDVKLDVKTHRVQGKQNLTYYNESADTLRTVYYHLYFNAFQPNSMMDVRSRNIADPDGRVTDRISKLSEKEIGYQKIESLKQDGKDVTWSIDGTVMEVTLAKPLMPKSKTTFDMTFESQVPLQIRRSGRDNKEGISYSMTQWYPKLAEYDHQGWHINPYVAREFHGVWGDYDVNITIDPTYVIGGTGKLQNPEAIGHGYEKKGTSVKKQNSDLTWHFTAKNVHDFAWAADPDYAHDIAQVPNGPEIHFFYQNTDKLKTVWKPLQEIAVKTFQLMNEKFGKYPFDTYSVIQGGDGGMEYPMCTLILGNGKLEGVAGTMIHEVGHSWFQMALGSNEAQYPWMDEGFTTFAANEVERVLFGMENPHAGVYRGYTMLALSGKEEPASQFSDFYTLNNAYRVGSYLKGCLMLNQLRYIMGEEVFWKAIHRYYDAWKFHHPEPNDFIRVMEKESGMQLKWFLNYWISTTKQIDYGVQLVAEKDNNTFVTLQRVGELPMPVDLYVTYADGTRELFYIPINETYGSRPDDKKVKRTDLPEWPWVNPTYTLKINRPVADVIKVEIDAGQWTADVHRENNTVDISSNLKQFKSGTH